MDYIYNDEDNAPMNIDLDGHNPTIYTSYAEMIAREKELPFTDPLPDGCWNCLKYDPGKEACTIWWNNAEEEYYNPATDDREPEDYCEEHETDPDAVWSDYFEEGQP